MPIITMLTTMSNLGASALLRVSSGAEGLWVSSGVRDLGLRVDRDDQPWATELCLMKVLGRGV